MADRVATVSAKPNRKLFLEPNVFGDGFDKERGVRGARMD